MCFKNVCKGYYRAPSKSVVTSQCVFPSINSSYPHRLGPRGHCITDIVSPVVTARVVYTVMTLQSSV